MEPPGKKPWQICMPDEPLSPNATVAYLIHFDNGCKHEILVYKERKVI